jgi:mono/diheme cytochrome c family protein
MSHPTRFLVSLAAVAAVSFAGAARAAPPPKKTPELVAKGKASYEINCAACHGAKGAGDGLAAATLDPKPRNLATAAFRNGAQPAQVFATLEKGIPNTGMVSFAHLPEEERWALTYYVLELRGGKAAKK